MGSPGKAETAQSADSLLHLLLSPQEQHELMVRLPAGTVVHRYGCKCNGILFIEQGTVEISWPTENKTINRTFDLGAGTAVGLTAAFLGGKYEFTATVKEPVIGCFVPEKKLKAWLKKSSANYLPLARSLSDWNQMVLTMLRSTHASKMKG